MTSISDNKTIIKEQYRCNKCGKMWYTDAGDECPRCKWREESGYSELMAEIMEVVTGKLSDIATYVREQEDDLRDQISEVVDGVLNKKERELFSKRWAESVTNSLNREEDK